MNLCYLSILPNFSLPPYVEGVLYDLYLPGNHHIIVPFNHHMYFKQFVVSLLDYPVYTDAWTISCSPLFLIVYIYFKIILSRKDLMNFYYRSDMQILSKIILTFGNYLLICVLCAYMWGHRYTKVPWFSFHHKAKVIRLWWQHLYPISCSGISLVF